MIRITAGIAGGRLIKVAPGPVRPTQDKVRQALFSSLGERVAGARVLDLFAGTGALGLEAWSRGAVSVCWVEQDKRIFRVLKENIKTLCGNAGDELRTVCSDAIRFLKEFDNDPFDLIMADPPYDPEQRHHWLENTLLALDVRSILAPDGMLIFEQGAGEPVVSRAGWKQEKDRRYGDTRLLSFTRETS